MTLLLSANNTSMKRKKRGKKGNYLFNHLMGWFSDGPFRINQFRCIMVLNFIDREQKYDE